MHDAFDMSPNHAQRGVGTLEITHSRSGKNEVWSEAGQGIRFGKPNRSQLPMVVFPCRSHHLTESYTRENQCDNLNLH